MLYNHKMTIEAKTIVDDVVICNHTAVMDISKKNPSVYIRAVDEDAYATHRKVAQEDHAKFEDLTFQLREEMNKW